MATKTGGFDMKAASTDALADFGGAADALIKRTSKTLDNVKAELRERGGNLPAKEELTAAGEDFTVTVGVIPEVAKFDELSNDAIIKMVGQEVFNAMASFPLGKLKEHLSKKDWEAIITIEDGTRRVAFKEIKD